jgi:hypothetical protein
MYERIPHTSKQLLVNFVPQVHTPVSYLLCHKDIPLKVYVFAWCLFVDRLLTNDNLFRRDILNQDSRLCVSGCGASESANHLVLDCNFFNNIWQYVRHWIDFFSVDPSSISDHFMQFGLFNR